MITSAMFRLCATCLSTIAIVITFSNTTFGQILTPISLNGTFSGDLNFWTPFNATITSAFPQSFQDYDAQGNVRYGGDMLRLAGKSYAYQIVPLSGASQYHLLNCVAYKASLNSPAEPGWAGIGVIYYAADWAYIDQFDKQIFTAFPATELSPFRPCSLGVRVPSNAAYAIIWAANDDANTQSFVDNLKLYDYQKAGYNMGLGPYLGSTSPISFQDAAGITVYLSGFQFWNIGGFVDTANGLMGNVGEPSWMAQEVDVTAGATVRVSLFNSNNLFSPVLPNFGVDYFDENWKLISGTASQAAFYGDESFITTAPLGTAHTIAWSWVQPLESYDQQVGILGVNVEPAEMPR